MYIKIIVGIIIVALIILLQYSLNRIIHMILFRPFQISINPKWLTEKNYKHVKINTHDGITLSAVYKQAYENNVWVLFFHGNGVYIGSSYDHFDVVLPGKYSKFVIDYRGYGESDVSDLDPKTIMIDARTAWDHMVNKFEISPWNIIIAGHSLGGAVATQLVHKLNMEGIYPRKLVLINTFSSVYDMAKKTVKDALPALTWICPLASIFYQFEFDTFDYLKNIRTPVSIIHSDKDALIPIDQATKNWDVIKDRENVTFVKVKGTHCSFDVSDQYVEAF